MDDMDRKNGTGELVVIGTTVFLPGFALAGVKHTVLARRSDVLEKIAAHKDAAIIVLDETLLCDITPQERDALDLSIAPIIIALSIDNTRQTERLRRNIMSTLGVDLMKA